MQNSLRVSDALTFDTVQGEIKRLEKALNDDAMISLSLDLQDVKQCDSAGLALLIEAKRLSRKYEKKVEINNASDAIQMLAEFCGVEEVLNDK